MQIGGRFWFSDEREGTDDEGTYDEGTSSVVVARGATSNDVFLRGNVLETANQGL